MYSSRSPLKIIAPKLGCGGCTPMPSQVSMISVPATAPREKVMLTTMRFVTLGSRCRPSTRHSEAPIARAASTYSLSRSDRTWERITRAMPTQPKKASAPNTRK